MYRDESASLKMSKEYSQLACHRNLANGTDINSISISEEQNALTEAVKSIASAAVANIAVFEALIIYYDAMRWERLDNERFGQSRRGKASWWEASLS